MILYTINIVNKNIYFCHSSPPPPLFILPYFLIIALQKSRKRKIQREKNKKKARERLEGGVCSVVLCCVVFCYTGPYQCTRYICPQPRYTCCSLFLSIFAHPSDHPLSTIRWFIYDGEAGQNGKLS
ncbi:hypothetical protein F4809DRAFT_599615 [Biscogniauxia mediterranea]|nr:hypothetical protein F4809DRAFT_599615 [Biscogniauxia mediterranea]